MELKQRPFSGCLIEPFVLDPRALRTDQFPVLASEHSPDQADAWSKLRSQLGLKERQRTLDGALETGKKLRALSDHYGLDIKSKGWEISLWKDLLLSHEPCWLTCRSKKLTQLFLKFNIEPTTKGADFELALRLAFEHVPGFQFVESQNPPCRLTLLEQTNLFMAIVAIRAELETSNSGVSDHQISSILCDHHRLSRFVPVRVAETLQRVVEQKGNDRHCNAKPMSERTLRSYMKEFREAYECYRSGHCSGFQHQFVEQVVPLIRGSWANLQVRAHVEKSL